MNARLTFFTRSAILAAIIAIASAMPLAGNAQQKKKILLDHYFNNEFRRNKSGEQQSFHYLWTDTTMPGYSQLGRLFTDKGYELAELTGPPAALQQQQASIYLIVDPDTEKETAHPNYISDSDVLYITQWVKAGGVLVLLANDSGNCEFSHLNKLANRFGITFNQDCRNRVSNDNFRQGTIITPAHDKVFGASKKIFIKEYSSLSLMAPARPVLSNDGIVVMAISKFGKGRVVALGDPWVYNEYIDHRRLPTDFQNLEAAQAWVAWLTSLP